VRTLRTGISVCLEPIAQRARLIASREFERGIGNNSGSDLDICHIGSPTPATNFDFRRLDQGLGNDSSLFHMSDPSARCFPAQPSYLPPQLNLWISLCRASSSHRVGLLCSSCSSARQFRLAFLPRSVTLPELASTGDLIFMFSPFGSFTGDFHPICNAPMLGAREAIHSIPAVRHVGCEAASGGSRSGRVMADVRRRPEKVVSEKLPTHF
jgi:hypothetical protein